MILICEGKYLDKQSILRSRVPVFWLAALPLQFMRRNNVGRMKCRMILILALVGTVSERPVGNLLPPILRVFRFVRCGACGYGHCLLNAYSLHPIYFLFPSCPCSHAS
jgi:hypothetical protein